jgi:DNA-directed RNA polymerase specialized sigma24 family protein
MFWSSEAYKIAKKITGGHELSCDLVSHVYLILNRYTLSEEDLPRTFARFAYNQWNWRESDFNKSMRARNTIEITDIIEEDQIISTDLQDKFRDYIESSPENDNELFCKEIAKMYICGMTYREIRSETGISLDMINKALKQFKYDVLNTIDSSRSIQSYHDSSPSRCETV